MLRTRPRTRELSWCTYRHHEPRTAPRDVAYLAEKSASLTDPESSKKRIAHCPGNEVCAEFFPSDQKRLLTLVPKVDADRQDGAAELASPRLLGGT